MHPIFLTRYIKLSSSLLLRFIPKILFYLSHSQATSVTICLIFGCTIAFLAVAVCWPLISWVPFFLSFLLLSSSPILLLLHLKYSQNPFSLQILFLSRFFVRLGIQITLRSPTRLRKLRLTARDECRTSLCLKLSFPHSQETRALPNICYLLSCFCISI